MEPPAIDQLAVWNAKLEQIVLQSVVGADGSHDVSHLRRVIRNAQEIADGIDEPVCRLTLVAAAWLHDIVSFEKNDPRRADSSRLAAEKAAILLREAQFPAELMDGVVHAIEAHSFSSGLEPHSIEAKILRDGDRLDALGAMGVARVFYVSGRIDTALYHHEDILAENRQLDDLANALDHFQTKILKLPQGMKTRPGRRIAEERAAFIRAFIEQFCREAGEGGATL